MKPRAHVFSPNYCDVPIRGLGSSRSVGWWLRGSGWGLDGLLFGFTRALLHWLYYTLSRSAQIIGKNCQCLEYTSTVACEVRLLFSNVWGVEESELLLVEARKPKSSSFGLRCSVASTPQLVRYGSMNAFKGGSCCSSGCRILFLVNLTVDI
jgi:hypothetical protein